MLSFHILYKLEPASNNLRIFAEGSLVVVLLIELDLELWLALEKGASPVLTYRLLVTLSE